MTKSFGYNGTVTTWECWEADRGRGAVGPAGGESEILRNPRQNPEAGVSDLREAMKIYERDRDSLQTKEKPTCRAKQGGPGPRGTSRGGKRNRIVKKAT